MAMKLKSLIFSLTISSITFVTYGEKYNDTNLYPKEDEHRSAREIDKKLSMTETWKQVTFD